MNFDHIFDNLEIAPDPFALCEIHGVCEIALDSDATATLHYVLNGEGEIVIGGQRTIPVATGSLVLVPSLVRHVLSNKGGPLTPAPKCEPAELELQRIMIHDAAARDDQGTLVAICARVEIGLRGAGNLVDLLREPLQARAHEGDRLHQNVTALLAELSRPHLGGRAMIRAILLQAIIAMLRQQLLSGDGALRWMAALRDPAIWNALRDMLDAPGEKHSVESLAEASGMSRSSFAKRFVEAYGAGPMELLRDLRMRKAARYLSDTDMPVKRIAETVGFQSRSAFSRQFEASTGQSPRQFRTSAREN